MSTFDDFYYFDLVCLCRKLFSRGDKPLRFWHILFHDQFSIKQPKHKVYLIKSAKQLHNLYRYHLESLRLQLMINFILLSRNLVLIIIIWSIKCQQSGPKCTWFQSVIFRCLVLSEQQSKTPKILSLKKRRLRKPKNSHIGVTRTRRFWPFLQNKYSK